MPGTALKWRWIFPLGQLIVCGIVLGPLWLVLLPQVHDSIAAYFGKAAAPAQPVSPELQRLILNEDYSVETERRRLSFERRVWTPAALNFPAGVLQTPHVMLSRTHEEWRPREMGFLSWRALSWPLAGLVFWWSAGKSVEGLLLARRSVSQPLLPVHLVLGIWEVICGAILYVLGVIFSTHLVGSPPPEVVATSGLVWIVLGAASITAFWLQRRLTRKTLTPANGN